MTPLSEHLLEAAVEAGEVPEDVARWVEDGARPDPDVVDGHDVDTAYRRAGRWEIDSVSAATWAFRKLAEAQKAKDEAQIQVEEEWRRLTRWLERATRSHANTIAFMEDRLSRWALRQREANPKQATFTTPAGKVETRWPSKPWTVEVADKQALLDWALANQRDDLIRPTLAPVTEVRKAVTVSGDALVVDPSTGEVVPGLTVEPTRPTVTVRPAATE